MRHKIYARGTLPLAFLFEFCYNERKIREGNEMDKKAVAVITTLVVGFLGSTFLGALLNWPDAGAICAIATMGCFVLHAIGDKKE